MLMEQSSDSVSSFNQFQHRFLTGRPWWQEIILVLILIAPSFTFGNEYILLLLPILLFAFDFELWRGSLKNPKQTLFSKEAKRYVWLSLAFVGIAGINKFINGSGILCTKDYYAAFYLIPVLLFSARYLFTIRTFRVFIYFALIETVFALFQYFLNDRSIILPLSEETRITSKDLLYDSRVYGFTVNSSVFALHILVAFLFLIPAQFQRLWYWVVFTALVIGMLLSFGRSVVLVTVVYFTLSFLQICWCHRKNFKRAFRLPQVQNVTLSMLFLLVLFARPTMRDSMTRGGKNETLEYNTFAFSWDTIPQNCGELHAYPLKEPSQLDTTSTLTKNFLNLTKSINTSGRKLIWLNYVEILSAHPWTGNGSNKLMFKTLNPKTHEVEQMHAHNSFFMIFGTHGFLLGTFYLVILLIWWKKKNFAILFTIIVYSISQYGIFWGFSLLDLVFIAALITPINFIDIGYKKQNS